MPPSMGRDQLIIQLIELKHTNGIMTFWIVVYLDKVVLLFKRVKSYRSIEN